MKLWREVGDSNSNGVFKEWDDFIFFFSSLFFESVMLSIFNGIFFFKILVCFILYFGGFIFLFGLIVSLGNGVLKFGYILKFGIIGEELMGGGGSGRLLKFGVWDNNNEVSVFFYILLFENVV